jgi:hypothetical protein
VEVDGRASEEPDGGEPPRDGGGAMPSVPILVRRTCGGLPDHVTLSVAEGGLGCGETGRTLQVSFPAARLEEARSGDPGASVAIPFDRTMVALVCDEDGLCLRGNSGLIEIGFRSAGEIELTWELGLVGGTSAAGSSRAECHEACGAECFDWSSSIASICGDDVEGGRTRFYLIDHVQRCLRAQGRLDTFDVRELDWAGALRAVRDGQWCDERGCEGFADASLLIGLYVPGETGELEYRFALDGGRVVGGATSISTPDYCSAGIEDLPRCE